MSARYVYGVVHADRAQEAEAILSEVTGLKGGTLDLLKVETLAAVISPSDGAPVVQTRRHMLAHTRVLEALCADLTVLPMRFGVIAEDEASLRDRLVQHRGRLEAALHTYAGLVEFGLSMSFPREAAFAAMVRDDPSFAARHAQLAALGHEAHFERIEFGRRVAEALDHRRKAAERMAVKALRSVCQDIRVLTPEADTQVLRAALLVPADAELGPALEAAAASTSFAPGAEAEISLVGPAPVYHFISLSLDLEAETMAAE
ncbi:MAG: GvpL/GvpF family gas vesicle protein [Pseudomonadota bacterium]